VTLITGADNDLVYIDDTEVYKALTVDTGAGADQVAIEANGADPGPISVFSAAVSVKTGDDDDAVTVGIAGQPGNSASFAKASQWDGGAGAGDAIDLNGNGNVFTVTPVVKNFETVS